MDGKELVSFPELVNYVWEKGWNMCTVVNEDKDKPIRVNFNEFKGVDIEGEFIIFEEDRFDLNKMEEL